MAAERIGDIEERVLAIVSEKTGYPPEMLELELDMEADLGIDTVKQVELFATIREEYELERDEGVNLSDYPTIRSVVNYIAGRLGIEEISAEVQQETAGTDVVESHPSTPPAVDNENAPRKTDIERKVLKIVSAKTGYPPEMLEPDLDMEADLGIDTVKQVELFAAIREEYELERDEGVNLSEYPTIRSVIDYIGERVGAVEASPGSPATIRESPRIDPVPIEKRVEEERIEEKKAYSSPVDFDVDQLPDYATSQFEPIAITGLGCIFPDSPNVNSFWNNVLSKKDSIIEVPKDRWNPDIYYDPDPEIPTKTYAKIGGFVTDFKFDPISFRIPPRSVDRIDDIQLWTLTAVKEAWEDAGYNNKEVDRTRVGVILANAQGGEYRDLSGKKVHFQETVYAIKESGILDKLSSEERERFIGELEDRIMGDYPSINEDTMPGELSNIIPARVTNIFDFKGPNFTTDAACAASHAAIDSAVKHLQARDIDIAISGGADRSMNPPTYVKFCKIGALSATCSRPFDDAADGFVMGEGAGILIMKRLSDAMRDGDKIYAVIRGIGSSSDGKGKGITAPNPTGQLQAIEMAHRKAGYLPKTVTLIEAHGTSTVVGDAVELKTLADIWSRDNLGRKTVGIGSIKSQIGHLKSAAGAAGTIKMVLALHNRMMPPTINYRVPNNKIDLNKTPLFVVTEQNKWERSVIGGKEFPLRGGVSSFGFGGSNFHITLEEYTGKYPVTSHSISPSSALAVSSALALSTAVPQESSGSDFDIEEYRKKNGYLEGGVVSLSAPTQDMLKERIAKVMDDLDRASNEKTFRLSDFTYENNLSKPGEEAICHRLAIAAPNAKEMLARLKLAMENIHDEKRMYAPEARGIAYSDPETIEQLIMNDEDSPRIGFIFPGQGSQYLNMLKDLSQKYRVVKDTFEESDRIMTGIIGRPLTEIIFSDDDESDERKKEKIALLRKTEITQPAMITGDIALYRLLKQFGVEPTAVAGHSLGEYGALVASGVMDFASALMAVAARGREMAAVLIDDKGKMASVAAGEDVIQDVLDSIDGYAIIANKNSYMQSVIAGDSKTVDKAVAKLTEMGITTIMLPVSHAFHSAIVAPAKEPLGRVLRGIEIKPPTIPTLTNVHGGLYPTEGDVKEKVVEILVEQIAGAVEWVKEMEIMYNDLGVRTFLEVGTKRALTSAVTNIFRDRPHRAILTNHPKKGGIQTFNEALAGLSACGIPVRWRGTDDPELYTDTFVNAGKAIRSKDRSSAPVISGITPDMFEFIELGRKAKALDLYLDRIVITGAGLGLPGKFKKVFDERNADLILDGVNLIDTIEKDYRKKFLDKNIVKLVKASSGQAHFEKIVDDSDVVKLAGQMGRFDLHEEYGVEKELVAALDVSTQLAIAAGLEAMRDAGIPLVRKYNRTSTGNYLPGNWELPEEMQEDTAVIFSTTFPGYDRLFELTSKYYIDKYGPRAKRELMNLYASLISRIKDEAIKRELTDGFADLYSEYSREMDESEAYEYNRKFMLNVLSIGHAQFAQFINARGPNIHNNAACATTTQAVGIAEDMLRMGRCKRVILISGDAPTSEYNMEWLVTSLLANGAATIEGDLEEAALPFDRRRKGLIVGMGAAAMVFERAEDVAARGMDPIVELMGTYTANSAYHATRLDTVHVASEMNHFFERIERKYGLRREQLVDDMVFISHETYTPARGGSSNSEKDALEATFGENFRKILVTNTKGFTGHAFGCGIEDVIALRLLQKGKVPPIANYKVPDPYLAGLRLSTGVKKYFKYALRFSAGFGSQIAMTFTKIVNTDEHRIINKNVYDRWLARMSPQTKVELEIVNRTLRIKDDFSLSARDARPPAYITPPPVQPLALPPAPVQTTSPVPVHTTSQAPVPIVAETKSDPISETVISIVSEKTGYPTDMLELDLDMEADLGIDTVKQVELFGSIREHYGVERDEGVNLSDYPTIRSVVEYIADRLGVQVTKEVPEAPVPVPVETAPVPQEREAPKAPSGKVEKVLIDIVSEKTGYPPDVLEMDLDMEADLGIDTVKQVELFGAIREHYGLDRDEGVNLSDYPTIGSVAGYIAGRLGISLTEEPSPAPSTPPIDTVPVKVPREGATRPMGEIEKLVINIVSDKTGYPPDMLEPDLDMEADLGIDTVKQVELFAAIREHYGLERDEGVNLSDYPTIGSVVDYIAMRLDAETPAPAAPAPGEVEADIEIHREHDPGQKEDLELTGEARDLRRYLTRFVPRGLGDKKRFELKGMNIIIVMDERDVGKKLKTLCKKKGANVIEYRYTTGKESLRKGNYKFDLADHERQVEVLGKVHDDFGKVSGVFYLQGMDEEIPLEKMNYHDWKAATAKKVKSLFGLVKAVIGDLKEASGSTGSFILSAVEMGGSFGIEGDGTFRTPVQGGITGLMKALGKEMTDVLVKSVDIGELVTPNAVAKLLLGEMEYGDGRLEVCYKDGERKIAQMYHEPADRTKKPNLEIDGDWVFIIPGGGFGITAEIAKDLSENFRPKIAVLDIVELPDDIEEIAALDDKGMADLKNRLFGEMKEGGKRVTPVMLEREFKKYTMPRTIFNNMKEMRTLGAEVEFFSADVTDHDRMKEVIGNVRERYGRIDCIIHAAGIEISKLISDKPPEQFAFVFDVKANGAFNLFELTRNDDVKAFVTFSSVAGRFGNIGQTDYSSANDLLNKYMDLNQKRYGDRCKAISTNWTGWRGVGMATRGSLLKIFDDAGVTLIPLDYGRKKVREELLYSGAENEVTIAGNVAFLDADKIILADGMSRDAWDLQQFLKENRSEYPLIDRIDRYEKGTKIIANKHLDHEIDLYLADHSIADTPYLPGVMGVEIFAEASKLMFPDMHPVVMEDVVFAMPIKLLRKRPMDIRIICKAQEKTGKKAIVNVTVESDFINPKGVRMGEPRIHFTGRVILKDKRPKARKLKSLKIPKGEAVKFGEVYDRFFHGPTFQVLGGVIKMGGKMKKGAKGWGEFREPVGDFFSFTPDHSFASGPMFREFGFQTCGMLDIYNRANMSLPNSIKKIELYDVPKSSKKFVSRIVYKGETGEGPMKITHYDVEIMDEKGNVIDRMTNYEMIRTGQIPEEKRF